MVHMLQPFSNGLCQIYEICFDGLWGHDWAPCIAKKNPLRDKDLVTDCNTLPKLYQYSLGALLPIVLDLVIEEVCTCNIIISTGMHQRHKYCTNIHWSGRVGIANDLRSGPDGAALM